MNRLKSFSTERIDLHLFLILRLEKKPDVGSEFTNCKQMTVFLESNQMPLDVTVPKLSTAGTILNQEVTNYTLANYRETVDLQFIYRKLVLRNMLTNRQYHFDAL